MTKIYLKHNSIIGYRVFEKAQTKNYILQDLYTFLSNWPQDMLALDKLAHANNLEWIEIEKDEDNQLIVIWSRFSLKNNLKFHYFLPTKEALTCLEAYSLYFDKKWHEIKKLKIHFVNYNQILNSWKKIKIEKPQYVIFLLDNSQDLNKVDIVGKNELSEQDLQEMQQEHEECLRWEKAQQLYNSDHEIVDDLWRSPADNVYNSDIEKYLDRIEGFVEHKKYTKTDVITELQKKLKSNEPIYLIVHWLRIRMVYGIAQSDSRFDDLLKDFAIMDSFPNEMIFREKLQEIADRLSVGQDVILD